MVASKNGHNDVVKLLLKYNVDPHVQDNDGETAVYWACYYGDHSAVTTLLNSGADPNIPTKNGETPLLAASKNGHNEIVELLLKANVITNNQNTLEVTTIDNACQNNHLAVDPGFAPLLAAGKNSHNDIVELLLKANVNPNIRNTNGETTIYLACERGHLAVVTTLLNYGCLLYTSPSPRDRTRSRMPSSA